VQISQQSANEAQKSRGRKKERNKCSKTSLLRKLPYPRELTNTTKSHTDVENLMYGVNGFLGGFGDSGFGGSSCDCAEA